MQIPEEIQQEVQQFTENTLISFQGTHISKSVLF